ncbi:uncharacterized protein [Eurosta solidaginis]|uniref:uncharacterized protein isoform X1 n=1 Tax=Eurosta solidaginis TaxID=178769 RepID=UPI003530FA07
MRTNFIYSIKLDDDVIPFSKFSNFYKFLRVMTWVRYAVKRFRSLVRNNIETFPQPLKITAKDIKETEFMVVRLVQEDIFAEDIDTLRNEEQLSKSSPLYTLTPIMDDQGILRLGGRIDNAQCVNLSTRRPIILPKAHVMSRLVVRHYHELFYHQNSEAIIGAIRSKYWIPNVRCLLRSIKSACQLCKNAAATPRNPLMGQVPPDRLTPYVRPFSFTGVDYFGPVLVSIGRRREKRWVALFTCLTVRAIHLEVAKDLSADAAILCLRNFVNRRGVPVRMRSDRGTNFVGASKIEWLHVAERLGDECTRRGIEWVFNTPGNPEAGGAWERMVRSVKRVLAFTLKEVAPQIETLHTLLIEAENLINSRPLTHLPLENIDDDPLTPNHFILGGPSYIQTSADSQETCLRKQWRILQCLKQTFWRRWVLEYLPTLTRRTKWYERVTPIKVGDVVIVCDGNENLGEWRRGIVLEVFVAPDGQFYFGIGW